MTRKNAMTDAPIYMNQRGEIAEIVLNRPDKLNALNAEIWETIPKLCGEIAASPDIKAVIFRGATSQVFAAGADISEFPVVHATPDSARAYHENIRKAYDAISDLDRPTIAMISGICFGGGCAIALCCDLRYADTTSRFCIPPAKLGIVYTLYETKHLSDLVGPAKAKEMLMGAKVIEAAEAERIGLVTRLFEPDALERETIAYAENLCNLSQYTIRAVKEIVTEILDGANDETATSRRLGAGAFDGPDYKEGRDAFLEKRTAKFIWS
jgi:enoyl-CoA hydratase